MAAFVDCKCPYCGNIFQKATIEYNFLVKKGKKLFFCKHYCSGMYYRKKALQAQEEKEAESRLAVGDTI